MSNHEDTIQQGKNRDDLVESISAQSYSLLKMYSFFGMSTSRHGKSFTCY